MNSERFYQRAHESRDRLKKEGGLDTDPVKFEHLRSEALEVQHRHIGEIRDTETAKEFGNLLDQISSEIKAIFPNDSYGETASVYFLKRAFEKASDEIGDWLVAKGRTDLKEDLTAAATTWTSAEAAGEWIDLNILPEFAEQDLFQSARDAKVEESELYYQQQKSSKADT